MNKWQPLSGTVTAGTLELWCLRLGVSSFLFGKLRSIAAGLERNRREERTT